VSLWRDRCQPVERLPNSQGQAIVHRKTIRHFHEPGHFHEFTFSCDQRRPLLLDEGRHLSLAEAVDAAGRWIDWAGVSRGGREAFVQT
jgi:hypothetical protein